MKQHEGKWEVRGKFPNQYIMAGKDCIVRDMGPQSFEEDVYLISAAPDLLFACKLVMAEYGEVFSHGGNQARAIFDKLTAAIAKAEGN